MAEVFQLFFRELNGFLPQMFWALLIFFFGFLVSKGIGKLASVFLDKARLNQVFQRTGWEEALMKIHPRFLASNFFGATVRWYFTILFLWGTFKIVGMEKPGQFLEKAINYYPNIFVAALIFIVAVFLADFSQKILVGTLEKEKIIYSNFLGRITRWLIWFFATLAILYQLKIASPLILVIFIGTIFALSIGAGIALGFGGKDLARKFLEELENKFK